MDNKKIIRIIQKLIQRTEENTIEWESSSATDQYITALSGFTIVIDLYRPPDEDEYYGITINDESGRVVERVTDYNLQNEWNRSRLELSKLYDMARRRAMGVDEALDKILEELDDDVPF